MAGYIGSKASVVSSGVERKKTYSITGSTTSLTGLNYTVGKVHVFQNGVRLLDGTDYTATNGTSITLTVAAQSGDNVVVVSQASFQLSEHYTSAEADAEFVTKTGDTMTGNLSFGDNDKAIFGAGSDLQIYHDGSSSYISEQGTGDLLILGSNLRIRNSNGNDYITCINDGVGGTVYIKHGNSTKLNTTSTGIDVTGDYVNSGHLLHNNNSGLKIIGGGNATNAGSNLTLYGGSNASAGTFRFRNGTATHLEVAGNGDISFYEDTGTTAKFFWDASAERLGLGTVAPNKKIDLGWDVSSLGWAYGGDPTTYNAGLNFDNPSRVLNVQSTAPDSTAAIKFSVGSSGQERMRIDSSGRVGVGTSSPSAKLDLNVPSGDGLLINSADIATIKMNTTSGTVKNWGFATTNLAASDFGIYQSNSNSGDPITAGTPKMYFSASGKVGISNSIPDSFYAGGNNLVVGSGSGSEGITIYGGAESNLFFADGTDIADNLRGRIEYSHGSDKMKFYVNNAFAMNIDATGALAVGDANPTRHGQTTKTLIYNGSTTTSDFALHVGRLTTGAENQICITNGYGKVGSVTTSGTSTSYNTSSDYRLKENLVDLTGASARVNQLNPLRFNWITDETNTAIDGFLAHEVATVVPEAINGTKDAMRDEEYEVTPAVLDDDGNVTTEAVMGTRSVPDYQGIDQSKLVPLLTAALQEALTEIASLKTRVEALEA